MNNNQGVLAEWVPHCNREWPQASLGPRIRELPAVIVSRSSGQLLRRGAVYGSASSVEPAENRSGRARPLLVSVALAGGLLAALAAHNGRCAGCRHEEVKAPSVVDEDQFMRVRPPGQHVDQRILGCAIRVHGIGSGVRHFGLSYGAACRIQAERQVSLELTPAVESEHAHEGNRRPRRADGNRSDLGSSCCMNTVATPATMRSSTRFWLERAWEFPAPSA
jgi:hypothetical protein